MKSESQVLKSRRAGRERAEGRVLKLLITGVRLECQTHSDSQRGQLQYRA